MKLAGADLSIAKSGLALTDGRLVTIVPAKGIVGYDRLRPMAQAILFNLRDADLVALEGYNPHPIGTTALIRAAEVGGIVRAGLNELGIRWLDVPPSTLKKRATGKGNAGKADVIAAAQADGAGTNLGDDEADAYWLRVIAGELIAWPETGGRPELLKVATGNASILSALLQPRE